MQNSKGVKLIILAPFIKKWSISDFPIHAKKILELRHEHEKMISDGLEMTTVFPIEADLDQKTFEYGKQASLDEKEKESDEGQCDPLQSALQTNSLIDLN